jgi:hypothetical protein
MASRSVSWSENSIALMIVAVACRGCSCCAWLIEHGLVCWRSMASDCRKWEALLVEAYVAQVMMYLMIVGGEEYLDNIDGPLAQDVRMERVHEDVVMSVNGLDAVKQAARSLWNYFDIDRKRPVLSARSLAKEGNVAKVRFQIAGYPDRGFAESEEVEQTLFLEVEGEYRIVDRKIIHIREVIRPRIRE